MKLSLVLSSLAISLVSATCFESGEVWGAEKTLALDDAKNFCNKAAGFYSPGSHKYLCYTLVTSNGAKKADFTLSLRRDVAGRYIGSSECLDGLSKEINGCSHGGDSTYTNWEYRADPNQGNCPK